MKKNNISASENNIINISTKEKGKKNMAKKANVIVKDATERNITFEKLCCMSQTALKKHLESELQSMKQNVIVGDGYIFSEGKFPVLLCAHMDTVHKSLPKTIIYEEGKVSSPEGIGGDDRCGIYMILQILREIDCPVVFFEDEEIGGVGSHKFSTMPTTEICSKLDVNYVIELDRMNADDAVFYECDNEEFEEFITREFYKTNWGSFTDICNICPEIGVAGVNLSCGYYKQHTTDEYVVLSEMETGIQEVIKLLKRTDKDVEFEYIEAVRRWDNWGGYYSKGTGSFYTQEWEVCYIQNGEEKIDYAYGENEFEAFYDFMNYHDDICAKDIVYFTQT